MTRTDSTTPLFAAHLRWLDTEAGKACIRDLGGAAAFRRSWRLKGALWGAFIAGRARAQSRRYTQKP
jgi:hypothetical protein